jgi:hypothetical protein
LLQAADPNATNNKVANVKATRRFRRNVHTNPLNPAIIVASSKPIPPPSPPPIPPTGGADPVEVVAPWQNVCIANATPTDVPFKVAVPGITLHVISADDGTHPNCTVPVTPGAPLIINP